MSEPRALSPLVQQLLDAFLPAAGGPALPIAELAVWSERMARVAEPRPLAEELAVVALRFRQRGAPAAVNQVVWLVAVLLGAERATAALAEAGLPAGEAEELVRAAQGAAPPLAAGLAPPGKGAGLRSRR